MNRLIFGCGYLGSRVASRWVNSGDTVYAITRNEEHAQSMQARGLSPIVADVTDPATLKKLPKCETVLFAVGMDRSAHSTIREVYVGGLLNTLNHLAATPEQFIYVSSTGVYGNFDGDWVNETSPTNPVREGGRACLEAESELQSSSLGDRSTILRFAGIYGPERVPTRNIIQSGQWNRLSPNGYLNLIHVDDGARVIDTVARHSPDGSTYNVSDGDPPQRRRYYERIARIHGIEQIPWHESRPDPGNDRSSANKRVSNRKLVERFKFEFEFPNYQAGLDSILNSPK